MQTSHANNVAYEPRTAQDSDASSGGEDDTKGAGLSALKSVPEPNSDEEEGRAAGDSSNDDHKKMRRVLANRSSARASYQRRKKMVSELQATVSDLSKQNNSLEVENRQLRTEIQSLKTKMHKILMVPNAPVSYGASSGGQLSLLDSLRSAGRDQHIAQQQPSQHDLIQDLITRSNAPQQQLQQLPPLGQNMSQELQNLLRERQYLAQSLALARNSGL